VIVSVVISEFRPVGQLCHHQGRGNTAKDASRCRDREVWIGTSADEVTGSAAVRPFRSSSVYRGRWEAAAMTMPNGVQALARCPASHT
jgi:hypothetical protein